MEEIDKYKNFSFFEKDIIKVKPSNTIIELPSLYDINIKSAAVCSDRLYFCSEEAQIENVSSKEKLQEQ